MALYCSIESLFHRSPCNNNVNIILFQWTLYPSRKQAMFSAPEKITLIFNLRTKQFLLHSNLFTENYQGLPGTMPMLGPAWSPPLCRTSRPRLLSTAAEQQAQLTRHIKTHLRTTPNASFDCSRLGQSQVKIVQPIVFQSLRSACQVLFGQLVQEADNRGWKRNLAIPS